jgi:hypothetical protein
MKKFSVQTCILLLTVSFLVSSCRKDRNEIPFTTSGFFTANTDSAAHIYRLTDDMGNVYNVENNDYIFDYDEGKPAQDTLVRVVATVCARNDGKYVITSKALPISSKALEFIPNNLKGRDPIKLKSIYIGGGHLNVVLGLMTENGQTGHGLYYMLKDKDSKHIRIKLYHNAHNDNPVYTQNVYLSIPLTVYNIQKNDTVLFSYTSYEGDCVEKLVYR